MLLERGKLCFLTLRKLSFKKRKKAAMTNLSPNVQFRNVKLRKVAYHFSLLLLDLFLVLLHDSLGLLPPLLLFLLQKGLNVSARLPSAGVGPGEKFSVWQVVCTDMQR